VYFDSGVNDGGDNYDHDDNNNDDDDDDNNFI